MTKRKNSNPPLIERVIYYFSNASQVNKLVRAICREGQLVYANPPYFDPEKKDGHYIFHIWDSTVSLKRGPVIWEKKFTSIELKIYGKRISREYWSEVDEILRQTKLRIEYGDHSEANPLELEWKKEPLKK